MNFSDQDLSSVFAISVRHLNVDGIANASAAASVSVRLYSTLVSMIIRRCLMCFLLYHHL